MKEGKMNSRLFEQTRIKDIRNERKIAVPRYMLTTTRTEIYKVIIICTINLLAVSAVFMTQSIFLEISETFNIDIARARFSFSIVSLFYSISFFFLGPAADKFNLPKIAVTGIVSLAIVIFSASYVTDYNLFIIAMALIGISAASIPASMFPYIVIFSPKNNGGGYLYLNLLSSENYIRERIFYQTPFYDHPGDYRGHLSHVCHDPIHPWRSCCSTYRHPAHLR